MSADLEGVLAVRTAQALLSPMLILEAIGVGIVAAICIKQFGQWVVIIVIPLGVSFMARRVRRNPKSNSSAETNNGKGAERDR